MVVTMIKSQMLGLQSFRSINNNLSTAFRSLCLTTPAYQSHGAKAEIPKRPANPWITYYSKQYPAFKKSYPTLSSSDLMKKIHIDWLKLGESEKEKMQTVYRNELETYKRKMEEVPKEMLSERKSAKKNKVDGKELRKAKKEKKDLLDSLNKPKRPLSSYMLYTMDRRPQLPSDMSSTDKVKKMGMEWKEANKQLKDFYENKYAELSKNYEKDLEMWNAKMHRDGKLVEIADATKRVKANS